jgi:hypothetical protein
MSGNINCKLNINRLNKMFNVQFLCNKSTEIWRYFRMLHCCNNKRLEHYPSTQFNCKYITFRRLDPSRGRAWLHRLVPPWHALPNDRVRVQSPKRSVLNYIGQWVMTKDLIILNQRSWINVLDKYVSVSCTTVKAWVLFKSTESLLLPLFTRK